MLVSGKTLDPNQVAIVKDENSFIAIAGAGSGKTLTIVGKVLYMKEKGFDLDELLLIAYTKNSARELEERLKKVGIYLRVHTFHSLAFAYNSVRNIISEDVKQIFLNHFFLEKVEKRQENIDYLISQRGTSNDKSIAYHMLKNDIVAICNYARVNKQDLNKLKVFNKYDKALKNLVMDYEKCYQEYKKDNILIDFDDMIEFAINKVKKPYKAVIIDEFQDISLIRFELVMSIVKKNKAKLYVFGDDFQGIYGFSGSKLEYFINFQKYSMVNNQHFILMTYRNSYQLLEISRKFIMKNKGQINKSLNSNKSIEEPVEIIYYDYQKAFEYIFSQIAPEQEVMILARYNFNEKILKDNKFIKKANGYIYQKHQNIKFLTCHKAKGLEADVVIVLEMINHEYGFPTKKKSSNLIRKIKTFKEDKFAEERRLFYVSLTRTRNKVYLISDISKPSRFIKELEREKGVKILKQN